MKAGKDKITDLIKDQLVQERSSFILSKSFLQILQFAVINVFLITIIQDDISCKQQKCHDYTLTSRMQNQIISSLLYLQLKSFPLYLIKKKCHNHVQNVRTEHHISIAMTFYQCIFCHRLQELQKTSQALIPKDHQSSI